MIVNPATLAPRLPPDTVVAVALGFRYSQTGFQAAMLRESYAESRVVDYDLAAVANAVPWDSLVIRIDRYF